MHLFEKVMIGTMQLENRIIMPALNLRYCPGGEINERIISFYERRALGGVGLIVVGKSSIEDNVYGDVIGIGHDRYIEGLRRLTSRLHQYDTKVAIQLDHDGGNSPSKLIGCQAIAPSAIPFFSEEIPKEATAEDIQELIGLFVRAAQRAKSAGFDAIELRASAGTLIAQFFSPLTNVRKDQYGGSLVNRMRFGLELVSRIKNLLGHDFPIIFRISGNEFLPGGNTIQEAAEFCKSLEKSGVDAFDVTGGWHETRVPQLTMQVPRGTMAYLAYGIKEVVNVPVVACNRITVPSLAEEIIRNGLADLVGLGRVLIADPDWPAKARSNREVEIRPCVACNQGCMDAIFSGHPARCLVNPEAGLEMVRRVEKAQVNKKVLIVGGGPGGMQSALVAAERGHQVTIWEQSDVLGGQMNLASRAPGRLEWESLRQYLVSANASRGVQIQTRKETTASDIIRASPDVVIVACGASPRIPNIKGVEYAVQSWDVLSDQVQVGKSVVIIGAGATGCEVALYLAGKGTISAEIFAFLAKHQAENLEVLKNRLNRGSKNINIIESGEKVGATIGKSSRWVVLRELAIDGINILTRSKVLEITSSGVYYEQDGHVQALNADTVILAVGSVSKGDLIEELRDVSMEVHVIGDAMQPRTMLEAIHEGYLVGCKI